jgi:hypothetical protein
MSEHTQKCLREGFAGQALQGLLANPAYYDGSGGFDDICSDAVYVADMLIKNLDKRKSK